jgi:hypothetical protein
MNKQSNRLWIVALILGWFFDFLFWKKSIGVNFAIFLTLCLFGIFYLLWSDGLHPAPKTLFVLVPFAFFAVMTFVRQEPLTNFLAYTFTFFSLGVATVSYLGGRWTQYNLAEYFRKFFHLIRSIFVLPLGQIKQTQEELKEYDGEKVKLQFKPILRGLLIALPIVVCFATLLASADLVFGQRLGDFIDRFDVGDIFENIIRFILILIYSYPIVGIYLHSASHSKDEKKDKARRKQILTLTETSIVLASVAILFGSFVIIQFRYLFGGLLNIGVKGYTFSQYARRGFTELLIVAFLSLLLVLVFSAITKRENKIQKRVYSGLSIVIVAQVLVILASSFHRTTLANQWHGYSRLRLYPQIFLVWLGLLFVAIVVLEIFNHERYFTFAAVVTSIGFAISLSIFNIDATIVEHNVERAVQGSYFNVTHLAMLSTDAVPSLVEEFQDASIPTEIHEGIGAALLCHFLSPSNELPENWQSFNFSQWRAYRALDEVEGDLNDYHPTGKGRDLRVRAPSNYLYLCDE